MSDTLSTPVRPHEDVENYLTTPTTQLSSKLSLDETHYASWFATPEWIHRSYHFFLDNDCPFTSALHFAQRRARKALVGYFAYALLSLFYAVFLGSLTTFYISHWVFMKARRLSQAVIPWEEIGQELMSSDTLFSVCVWWVVNGVVVLCGVMVYNATVVLCVCLQVWFEVVWQPLVWMYFVLPVGGVTVVIVFVWWGWQFIQRLTLHLLRWIF